jgi:hypothetical protein
MAPIGGNYAEAIFLPMEAIGRRHPRLWNWENAAS